MLRQVGSQRWTTTVLLTDNSPGCKGKPAFWLETTSPDKTIPAATPVTVTAVTSPGTGSSCNVTAAFTGLGQVPQTAALVVNQAGASSVIPLTVSRDVTLYYYLGIPVIVGIVMALAGLFLSMLRVRIFHPGGRPINFLEPEFWQHPLIASGAWALNDSWATNITTGLIVVGTVLSTVTATSSLFPGVALDRFALVNVIIGGIVVAAPLMFAILYAGWTRRVPGLTADASLTLPCDADLPPDDKAAIITVPSGATITLAGGATVKALDDARRAPVKVKAGGVIQVPPGSGIRVEGGGVMSLPGTTSDITVRPEGRLRRGDAAAGAWIVAAGDQVPPKQDTQSNQTFPSSQPTHPLLPQLRQLIQLLSQQQQPKKALDAKIDYLADIDVPAGARISVAGVADVTLPRNTRIRAPRAAARSQEEYRIPRPTVVQVPQGASMLVANMRIVLLAAVVTTFGIGAELGIAGVLAYGLSEANQSWRIVMLGGTVLAAIFVLWYAVTAIGALADPQPGSSLSGTSGTSFTL